MYMIDTIQDLHIIYILEFAFKRTLMSLSKSIYIAHIALFVDFTIGVLMLMQFIFQNYFSILTFSKMQYYLISCLLDCSINLLLISGIFLVSGPSPCYLKVLTLEY